MQQTCLVWADYNNENTENNKFKANLETENLFKPKFAKSVSETISMLDSAVKVVFVVSGQMAMNLVPKLSNLKRLSHLYGIIIFCQKSEQTSLTNWSKAHTLFSPLLIETDFFSVTVAAKNLL